MIPIRDNQASRRLTTINFMLIAMNVAVFAYEVSLGVGLDRFVDGYAMVPARITRALGVSAAHHLRSDAHVVPPLETLVTSMFLHGGLLHIAGNMLYLFIFGAAVEEAMGHVRYLTFYMVAGIAAALAMAAFMPDSSVPVIGASGAIAGVLGAYFVLYPRARILTIMPVFVFFYFIEIPAVLYLLIWYAAQLYWGLYSDSGAALGGGVAWWAHVGGFLFGMALGPMLVRGNRRRGRRR